MNVSEKILFLKNILNCKSNIHFLFKTFIIILYGIAFFSIPVFSFKPGLNSLTWVLTSLFAVCIIIDLIFFDRITINLTCLCLLLLPFSMLISSALNRFTGFSFTPILMSILVLLFYEYGLSNKQSLKYLLVASFIGTIGFLLVFFIEYRNDFLSFNFERLGSEFGNINDASMFLSYGSILSFSFLLFGKNYHSKTWFIIKKIVLFLLFVTFFIAGLSTGSKQFIFIIIVSCLFSLFFLLGKKYWYISIIIFALIIFGIVLIISLPFFDLLKTRLLSFIQVFLPIGSTTTHVDYSSIERNNMFFEGLFTFLRKPIFGFGVNGFHAFSSYPFRWSHNTISDVLMNFGLVGFILFFYPFVNIISNLFARKCSIKNNQIFINVFLLFFMFIFFDVLTNLKIFAFTIGLVYSYLSQEKVLFSLGQENRADKHNRKFLCVCAEFSSEKNISFGAGTKIHNVYEQLIKRYGDQKVFYQNYPSWKKRPLSNYIHLINSLKDYENIIIMPNKARLSIFLKILHFYPKKYRPKVFYPVVGGWITDFSSKKRNVKKLKLLSGIFVETNGMKNILENNGLKNVYYSPVFSSRSPISFKEYSIKNNQFIDICTFGRVTEDKGILLAIEAVNIANKKLGRQLFRLHIYGKMPESEKNVVLPAIEKNKQFVSKPVLLDDDKVLYELSNNFILLFPTYFYGEGFPATILESFMASTPVIASDWKYNKEIVNDGECGWIVPLKDSNSIAEKLIFAISNLSLIDKMRLNCYKKSKDFTPENCMKIIFDLIDSTR